MYQLGNLVLPYPKKFTRTFVELGAQNLLIEGTTTLRVQNRKEIYTLEFVHLTKAQVNSILSEYELNEVRTFTVTEDNLPSISADVLVDVSTREYPPSAKEFRENLSIILTEVK